MSKLSIHLKSFKCYEDTSEHDSDEPYVLVFAARILFDANAELKFPVAHTVMYGRWGNIDSGDRGVTGQFHVGPGGAPLIKPASFWGLDGEPAPVDDDTLFLVALMENDNGTAEGVRAGLHAQLFAALSSYCNSDMQRDVMVDKLLQDMRDCLSGAIIIGVPNGDDLVNVAELRIAPDASGVSSLHIKGDGAHYELFFQIDRMPERIDIRKLVSREATSHRLRHRVD